MANDKNGNTLARGDIVRLANGNLAEIDEPLTDSAIVSETITQSIDPATCEIAATVDGRAYATTPPPAPEPAPTPEPTALLTENFEGAFSTAWTAPDRSGFTIVPHPTDPAIVSNPRSGSCAQVRYVLNSTGDAHQDDNKFLWFIMSQTRNRLRVKGSVLIPLNTVLHGQTRSIQRKLIYWKSNYIPDGTERPAFGIFLTTDVVNATDNFMTLRIGYGGGGGAGASIEGVGRIYPGAWNDIDTEIILNSPSLPTEPATTDGVFRLWLNGALIYENTTMDFRSAIPSAPDPNDPGKSADYMLQQVEIGRQVDRMNYDTTDELRFWDDVVIS